MIILGFSTSNDWVSKSIRWFTKSTVSHVYFKLKLSDSQEYVIIHAYGLDINLNTEEKFFKDTGSFLVKSFLLDKTLLSDNHIKQMFSFIGVKYPYHEIVGIGIQKLWKKIFNKDINNPFTDRKRMVCSQYAAKIMGFYNSESYTPQTLLEHMEKLNG